MSDSNSLRLTYADGLDMMLGLALAAALLGENMHGHHHNRANCPDCRARYCLARSFDRIIVRIDEHIRARSRRAARPPEETAAASRSQTPQRRPAGQVKARQHLTLVPHPAQRAD